MKNPSTKLVSDQFFKNNDQYDSFYTALP